MGSCPSHDEVKQGHATGQSEVKLAGSSLRFTREQLLRLNLHFARLEQEHRNGVPRERSGSAADVVVERLVQRLVCAVGTLDPRFAAKFLTTLDGVRDGPKHVARNSFEYLVRLDRLSTPAVYPDTVQPCCRVAEGAGGEGAPQGFVKIRLQGEGTEEWAEFINQGGFLRRDKIQERFVELLALAAARAAPPHTPDDVDESRLCGSPGKVVDVGVLHHILRLPADQQVFYGSASCNQSRFPDPRDFRIAILESSPHVRLRVGFLSPALRSEDGRRGAEEAEVKLVLGIGCHGWPQSSDFPARVALGHVDCLLYHQMAQTGFYLMPAAPHSTVRCDDRTATWQVWVPAAELTLLTHYAAASVPSRVLSLAEAIVDEMRGGNTGQDDLRVVSRYMLRTLLFFQLERTSRCGPAGTTLCWAPDTLSGHVLRLLDVLVSSLRTQRHRSYFFPGQNVMLHAVAAGVPQEDAYLADADMLHAFLQRLHEESLSPTEEDGELGRYTAVGRLERRLLRKWGDVVRDLAPPPTTRSCRMGFSGAAAAQYSPRQLDYIGQLFRGMLAVKQLTLQNTHTISWLQAPLDSPESHREDPVEDLIYLLTAILEQAKLLTINNNNKQKRNNKTRTSRLDENTKFRSAFESSVVHLLSCVRQDVATATCDLGDDLSLVRQVLRWLYRALDEDRRRFGPALRPYLAQLFAASHDSCWHMAEWRARHGASTELHALGRYCQLLLANQVTPRGGLEDAVAKKWLWAQGVVGVVDYLNVKAKISALDIDRSLNPGLQLVLAPSCGLVVREVVTLPFSRMCDDDVSGKSRFSTFSSSRSACKSSGTGTMQRNTMRGAPAMLSALCKPDDLVVRLQKACYAGFCCVDEDAAPSVATPPHRRLRDASPLTAALDAQRRYGHHRGVGDVVRALVALHKFSVLQDVASLLPDESRLQALDAIQKLSKETRRACAQRRLNSAPQLQCSPQQTYRARGQPSRQQQEALEERERRLEKELDRMKRESLLGTVRAARSQGSRPSVLTGVDPVAAAYRHEPPVALLELTEDRQLRLAPPKPMAALQSQHGYRPARSARKRDIVTKL